MLIAAGEVAEILGVSVQTVYDYACDGRLKRHAPSHVRRAYDHAEVESFTLQRLRRQRHAPHHYWATADEAASILGMSRSNVRQMMLAGRLPYETAVNGRRYIRRRQLEVIANARDTRLTEEAMHNHSD